MQKEGDSIQFKIVTPEGVIYGDRIDRVTIPTTSGEITVLPNHVPMVSILAAGELLIKKDDTTVALAVSTGMIEIRPASEVYVMADTAERAEDIDVARAEEARKRAEELLKQQENVVDVDFARLQASIEKEMARLRVARKYR